MLLEMPVIPPKQASFTLLVSIPYCVGRHLNDTKVYILTNVPPILPCLDSKMRFQSLKTGLSLTNLTV